MKPIMFCIGVGFAINVVIATTGDLWQWNVTTRSARRLPVIERWAANVENEHQVTIVDSYMSTGPLADIDTVFAWVALNDPPDLSEQIAVQRCRSGWPMRALRGERILLFNTGQAATAERQTMRGAFSLRGPQRELTLGRAYMIPLMPMPLGFIVNTVAFAAALWLVFAAPLRFVQYRRRCHGRCWKCGYDLHRSESMQSSRCPECGSDRRNLRPQI